MTKEHYHPLTNWHLQTSKEKVENATEGIKGSKSSIEFSESEMKGYKEDIKKAEAIVFIGLIIVLLIFINHGSYNFGIICTIVLAIGANWYYMCNKKIEDKKREIEDCKEEIRFFEKMIADNTIKEHDK